MSPSQQYHDTQLEAGLLRKLEEEKRAFGEEPSPEHTPNGYPLASRHSTTTRRTTMDVFRRMAIVVVLTLVLALGLASAMPCAQDMANHANVGAPLVKRQADGAAAPPPADSAATPDNAGPPGTLGADGSTNTDGTNPGGNPADNPPVDQGNQGGDQGGQVSVSSVFTTVSTTVTTVYTPSAPPPGNGNTTTSTTETPSETPTETSTTSTPPTSTTESSTSSPSSTSLPPPVTSSSISSTSSEAPPPPTSTRIASTITIGHVSTSHAIPHTITSTLAGGGVTTILSTSWVVVVPTSNEASGAELEKQNAAPRAQAGVGLAAVVGIIMGAALLI